MRLENVKGAVWTVDDLEFAKHRPLNGGNSASSSPGSSSSSANSPAAIGSPKSALNDYLPHDSFVQSHSDTNQQQQESSKLMSNALSNGDAADATDDKHDQDSDNCEQSNNDECYDDEQFQIDDLLSGDQEQEHQNLHQNLNCLNKKRNVTEDVSEQDQEESDESNHIDEFNMNDLINSKTKRFKDDVNSVFAN